MSDNFPFAIFNVRFSPLNDRNGISKKILKHNFGIEIKKGECSYFNLINVLGRLIKPKKKTCSYINEIKFPKRE